MFIKILLSAILILSAHLSFAQDSTSLKYYSLGVEMQLYPTGFLLGARGEIGFSQQSIDFRIGYNFINHRDQGVQANEEGGGYGFTLGYRYYLNLPNDRFFIGVRSDFWFNEIIWQDENSGSGTTNIVVLQPTVNCGYVFLIKENWTITPTLAFGWEMNIFKRGEPVGQGAILLIGLNLSHRFTP